MTDYKKSARLLSIFIGIYIMMIFRWGYEFGRNDQMQTLSYALMIHDDTLYPNDFFLQGIDAYKPNERWVISLLLSPFANQLPLVSIIGHLLCTLGMLWGLYKIADRYIEQEIFKWLSLLVLFIPLYGINLGGNELYYNSFFVSNVIKLMGVWGIWYFLNSSYFAAFSLFALSTFLQPVMGTQLYVTLSAVLFFAILFKKSDLNWKSWIILNMVFLFTAGVWLVMLRSHFAAELPPGVEDRFFETLYIFRSPHHYWPAAYPLKHYLLLVPLFIFGTWYYKREGDDKMLLFMLMGFAGCIVYTIGMLVFRIDSFGALQWFKITIWMKAFAIIAVMGWLEDFLPFLKAKTWRIIYHIGFYATALFCLVMIVFFHQKIPMNIPFDYGWQIKEDPAVEIAIQAKELTPKDALFAHPILYTELKYYGRRSSFVDYKVLVHTKPGFYEWHKRIEELYGVGLDIPHDINKRQEIADNYFRDLSEAQLDSLKAKGVTHILTFADDAMQRELIASNEGYRIYKL